MDEQTGDENNMPNENMFNATGVTRKNSADYLKTSSGAKFRDQIYI